MGDKYNRSAPDGWLRIIEESLNGQTGGDDLHLAGHGQKAVSGRDYEVVALFHGASVNLTRAFDYTHQHERSVKFHSEVIMAVYPVDLVFPNQLRQDHENT